MGSLQPCKSGHALRFGPIITNMVGHKQDGLKIKQDKAKIFDEIQTADFRVEANVLVLFILK